MQIDKHTVVTLHYRLQEDNAEGELIEETFNDEPLTFLYGVGSMIPQFESNLKGKNAGDSFSFGISHQDAYGEYDNESVVNLPISAFTVDGRIAKELLEPGRRIPMQDQDGNHLNGTVTEVKNDTVTMDFNHPLAGVDLFFSGKVEEVRAATESEIAHGHVHGPGGHHHH